MTDPLDKYIAKMPTPPKGWHWQLEEMFAYRFGLTLLRDDGNESFTARFDKPREMPKRARWLLDEWRYDHNKKAFIARANRRFPR